MCSRNSEEDLSHEKLGVQLLLYEFYKCEAAFASTDSYAQALLVFNATWLHMGYSAWLARAVCRWCDL